MPKSIIKSLSVLTFANLLVKPIWFVFITYVCIRQIGVSDYGMMTSILALMSISDGFLSLGTSQYSIREIAKSKDLSADIFSNFFSFRSVSALVALLIGLGAELLIGNAPYLTAICIIGLYIWARNLVEYCRAIFRGHENFNADAIITIIEKCCVIVLGSVFVFTQPTLVSLLTGMMLGMLLTLAIVFTWVSSRIARFSPSKIRLDFFRRSLPSSIPMGLASIFILIYMRTDSLMIEAILGPLSAGQYAIGFRILEALVIIPSTVVIVLLPRMSVLFKTQPWLLNRLSFRWTSGLTLIGVLTAFIISSTAPLLIGLIEDSPSAEPAILILQILVWSFPLSAGNYLISTLFVASNRQNLLAIILGLAAIMNILLNYYLIPIYSAPGAAFATIATQMFVLVAFLAGLYFSQENHRVIERVA